MAGRTRQVISSGVFLEIFFLVNLWKVFGNFAEGSGVNLRKAFGEFADIFDKVFVYSQKVFGTFAESF